MNNVPAPSACLSVSGLKPRPMKTRPLARLSKTPKRVKPRRTNGVVMNDGDPMPGGRAGAASTGRHQKLLAANFS